MLWVAALQAGLLNEGVVKACANCQSLSFKLQEAANGHVSGTGTMQECDAATPIFVNVTGTFNRPLLSLTFEGMVFETRAVTGAAQGNYTTVGGIGTTLRLTAPGYSRDMGVLLQEK